MSCFGAFPHGLASSLILAIKVGSTRTWAAGLNTRPGSGGVMVASGNGSVDQKSALPKLFQLGSSCSLK